MISSSPESSLIGYSVDVDCSQSLDQMIRFGKYYNQKDAICIVTEAQFPVNRDGTLQYRKELFLVPPSRRGIVTASWKEELEASGWILEQSPELFALGAQHPLLQLEMDIVAFGSFWFSSDEDRYYSPLLWGGMSTRNTRVRKVGLRWYSPTYEWSLYDRALVSRRPSGM